VTRHNIATGSAGKACDASAELNTEARERERRLFAQVDSAKADLAAVEAERALRAPGSDFTDLNERQRAAEERWDEAMFTLSLVVGHTREDAIYNTHAGFRVRQVARSHKRAPLPRTEAPADVIPLRARDALAAPIRGASFVGQQAQSYISVAELAQRLGQTDGATRRLLELGSIPGARRKTPGLPNSPWLIPANAATKFLATFETQGVT
jgi:hypothetical protein